MNNVLRIILAFAVASFTLPVTGLGVRPPLFEQQECGHRGFPSPVALRRRDQEKLL